MGRFRDELLNSLQEPQQFAVPMSRQLATHCGVTADLDGLSYSLRVLRTVWYSSTYGGVGVCSVLRSVFQRSESSVQQARRRRAIAW